jgi:cell pole-organizing protein PopZ
MEEILASIRRIISEDDAPAAEPVAAAAPAAVKAEPAPAPEPEPDLDDVLELTQAAHPPPAPAPAAPPPVAESTLGDLDVFEAPRAAAPPPRPAPAPAAWSAPVEEDEPLIAEHSADTAAGHFGALAQSLSMPASGRTLEDVVRELLRPLLKDWLDQNLPGIVETAVQAEVERISRRRVR